MSSRGCVRRTGKLSYHMVSNLYSDSRAELCRGVPERDQVGKVELEQGPRWVVGTLHLLGSGAGSLLGQQYELDAAIGGMSAPLHQALRLEAVDDPGRGRGIALPLLGQRPHCPA